MRYISLFVVPAAAANTRFLPSLFGSEKKKAEKAKKVTLKEEKNRHVLHTEHGGERTREGAKSGTGRVERMKRGNGIKGRDDRSNGIEILMSDTYTKINNPIVTGPCDC
jgi:hypothetical protein